MIRPMVEELKNYCTLFQKSHFSPFFNAFRSRLESSKILTMCNVTFRADFYLIFYEYAMLTFHFF